MRVWPVPVFDGTCLASVTPSTNLATWLGFFTWQTATVSGVDGTSASRRCETFLPCSKSFGGRVRAWSVLASPLELLRRFFPSPWRGFRSSSSTYSSTSDRQNPVRYRNGYGGSWAQNSVWLCLAASLAE